MNKRDKNIEVEDVEFLAANILERLSCGVLITDSGGKICYWNKGMERLFGYSAEEIIGQKAELLYPDPKKENFKQDLEKIKSGDTMTGQWLGKNKDGAWIWVDLNAHLLKDREGVARGIIS
ncbi:MAG TPA: PAS domain-containing protein, partial [Massilibacterium sp.]|nr:PAS domain-containing protein [Massilibacterium sp.]